MELTQADFDKLNDKVASLTDLVETERAKNQGLLDDLKKAQRDARTEIKPEDLAAAEDQRDQAKADLAKATKALADATKRAEALEKTLEGETGYTSKLLTENALNQALAEAGVKEPAMLKAVKAMMAGTAQVVTEGEARTVKIGDKALADYIKEWSGTDEAKHFISAGGNSGGGATGGAGGGAPGKTIKTEAFNALSPKDKAATMAAGVTIED